MDTKEMLLEILNNTDKLRKDIEQSRLKKLWKDIPSANCSIQEALEHLSKDELSEIRRYHGLKNMSTLKKKELVTELSGKLPEVLADFMKQMDEGRYQLFKSISQNDGVSEIDEAKINQLEVWRKTGFIFSAISSGRKVLFIPHEILEAFRALDESNLNSIIHRNTLWILLTQGMLYFYGVMRQNQISDKIHDLTGEEPDTTLLNSVLLNAYEFYERIKPYPNELWSDSKVPDPEKVMHEHNARANIDFIIFSKGELLQAGQAEYVHEDSVFKRFQSFLMKEYQLNSDQTKRITNEAQQVIKANLSPTAVIDYLGTQLKFPTYESVQRIADEAMYLTNNTRQWVIKGHTPTELREIEKKASYPLPIRSKKPVNPVPPTLVHPLARKHKKIGRNAPCPCGSGKKYKHCCGKG